MAIAARVIIVFLVLCIGSTEIHALNGDVDVDNQFPFVVRITAVKGNILQYCTASMRTKRMAITAAHCVYDEKTGSLLRNIRLQFKDERGSIRRVAAKAFISADYPGAERRLRTIKTQFDKAKAKNDQVQTMALSLPLLEAHVGHISRDFALLLPASDVNVPAFLPATIMDDDLPFAATLSAFQNSLHRWTPDAYGRAVAAYKENFVSRMPVAPGQDDMGRTSEMILAHAVGYGRTCRSEKDNRCELLDGKRRHSPILLENRWYYPGGWSGDASLMLTLFRQDQQKRKVMLPGDSGGPILIRDKITGRFTQVGVVTSTNNAKSGSFWAWAACLLQHAGMWKGFLSSEEYQDAMLASSKPRQGR